MLPLLDKQATAFEKLRRLKVGALFMDAGTGKTRVACELANSVPNLVNVIYVAPYRTIHSDKIEESVVYEVERWGFNVPVEFVGVESIQSSDRIYMETLEKINVNTFLVVDESLKIKNHEAKRTKRLIAMGEKAGYRLILNGTPLSRNLLDLWAQMHFLSPKILGMNLTQFKNTFCEWVKLSKRIGQRSYSKEFIVEYHNLDYLYSLIQPYVFEADLELDVTKQYIQLDYEISQKTKEQYEWIKQKVLDDENLMYRSNNIFLELTQKMQHNYSCEQSKIDILTELVKKHPNIVVVCKFVASTKLVKKHFPKITVLTYSKHTFGLNMQRFSRMVFFDKTWDYAMRIQMEGRIYRTNQTQPCYYYTLHGDVKLESLFEQNVDKKGKLLQRFKQLSMKQLKEVL